MRPQMAELVRTFEWSSTPLGAMDGWPAALKTAVRLMLASRFPMWMAAGPQLIVLYNDAYAKSTLGRKHPGALGRPAPEVWSEVWGEAGSRIEQVMQKGEASWDESLMLILARSGYPEETYHTFSYSPIEDIDGKILGMLCVVSEETTRMIGERQLATLSTLAAELSGAITQDEVFAAIARGVANHKDMPCTLTYLFNEEGTHLNLVARTGVDAGHPAAASTIELAKEPVAWPIHLVMDANRAATVDNLLELFPELPPGCWDKPPSRARLSPITKPGQSKPIGIFITALNPYREFDSFYGDFLDLVAGQIASAITNAQAFEEEKKRMEEISEARRFAWEVLEHIPDSFCAFDRDFRITYMNRAAMQVAAMSGKPHLGHVLWDLYPMLKGTPVEAQFRRAMDERVLVEFEQYFEDSANQTWWKFLIFPHPEDGVILYLQDTTKKQRTEEALRSSEKLAAAGRLAASIAHEINNPLEAVTNLLFLAKLDTTVGGNTKNLLDVADSELQRLSHIAARSLKFYRQRTAPAPTSIEDLLESVLFFYEPDVKMRRTRLERRYREAPPVLCLPGEIQQVLTNLIGNSLDAMKETGRLIVAVRPATDRHGRKGVNVTVADAGHGMSQATLERLFHPFMTTKGDAGTGLGLWVSKGILDKHHATIAVRSQPGCGTVFRLFLPENTTIGPADQIHL